MTQGGQDALDDLAAELDTTFLGELGERLTAMNAALTSLATRSSELDRGATLEELTRHAHSVKGGALLVGREEIARLAGALEARFARDQANATAPPVPPEAEEALAAIERLSTVERQGLAGPAPELRGGLDPTEIERLVAALERQPN